MDIATLPQHLHGSWTPETTATLLADSPLKCGWITVTPDLAKQLLKRNQGNRPLRKLRVNRLARTLKQERWLPSNDAIALTADYRLLNGQHRLSAIVRTGIPAVLLFAFGLPEEAFKIMDRGSQRSPGDLAQQAGFSNGNLSAAGARAAMGILNTWSAKSSDFNLSRFLDADEIVDWMASYPEIVESISFVSALKDLRRHAELVGLHFAVGPDNHPWLEDVLTRANKLIIRSENDPARHVRLLHGKETPPRKRTKADSTFLLTKLVSHGIKGRKFLQLSRRPKERLAKPPTGWRQDAVYTTMPENSLATDQ